MCLCLTVSRCSGRFERCAPDISANVDVWTACNVEEPLLHRNGEVVQVQVSNSELTLPFLPDKASDCFHQYMIYLSLFTVNLLKSTYVEIKSNPA